jgi:hypothetical protein
MRYMIGILLLVLNVGASAAIVAVPTSQSEINAVRVESRWGFVSFSNHAGPAACPANRVYLNLDNEIHRVAYSTALAAFMSGKPVAIRADDVPSKVFGACALYDIYVVQ